MVFTPVASHIVLGHVPCRVEGSGNDSHGLLGVIAAVPDAVRRRRKQLQPPKQGVDRLRRRLAHKPVACARKQQRQGQAY